VGLSEKPGWAGVCVNPLSDDRERPTPAIDAGCLRWDDSDMTSSVPQRASYSASIESFLKEDTDRIIGQLTTRGGDVLQTQVTAWEKEIEIMKGALPAVDGWIFFEFDIPRLGSRVDVVVVFGQHLIPIEFKVDQNQYTGHDIDQSWDYALDLKNFHRGSHKADIWPLLVATEAKESNTSWQPAAPDSVRPPRRVNASGVFEALQDVFRVPSQFGLDGVAWSSAPYEPTPTIIQAAQALYSKHTVQAIARNDAGAQNLHVTSRRVEEVARQAEEKNLKAIVFVTGVPGAGKTLVGLDIATAKRDETLSSHAVFLSGNGPLVAVLTESLVRDEVARRKRAGTRKSKVEARQPIKKFIQNVHHFRDDGIRDPGAPHDHVVIFDEAQRAWDLQQTANFMKRRKRLPGFSQSEPEFLISYMDRHPDWAVIVCLVGGGQEINTGEAGIGAWLDAISKHFPHWHVYISPSLGSSEYRATEAIATAKTVTVVNEAPELHLAVSMRSFRSERLSDFVRLVLDCEESAAFELFKEVVNGFPLVMTRNLDTARAWIRSQARGTQQFGLLASSSAHRLKPHAVDIRIDINPVHWFLGEKTDTRSSYYLEDAATEFQVQGLELDWSIVAWDADLRRTTTGWSFNEFRGSKWNRINKPERQRYLMNAYRVLLTRARQGSVVFVPKGDSEDDTRRPAFYEGTYEYLRRLGVAEI
jgi:hypothetical protein